MVSLLTSNSQNIKNIHAANPLANLFFLIWIFHCAVYLLTLLCVLWNAVLKSFLRYRHHERSQKGIFFPFIIHSLHCNTLVYEHLLQEHKWTETGEGINQLDGFIIYIFFVVVYIQQVCSKGIRTFIILIWIGLSYPPCVSPNSTMKLLQSCMEETALVAVIEFILIPAGFSWITLSSYQENFWIFP